jgi:hypothetical protein
VSPSSYVVRRRIAAAPQVVWDLLTDAPGYPSWNPAVMSLGGRIAEGERIDMVSVVAPTRTFRLQVTGVEPGRRMRWVGGLPLGLFRGVRTFTLAPRDGGTDFTMEEVMSGPLSPLMNRVVPDMTDSFVLFGDGLRDAAEERARG